MNKLDRDVLSNILDKLELPDLLRLSFVNQKTYNLIETSVIWFSKLSRDFPDLPDLPDYWNWLLNLSPKDRYIILYRLRKLKNQLELSNNIYSLLADTELKSSHNNLKILPKEIGILSNLKELDLSWNQISYLPKELYTLINLEKLYLHHNNIIKIDKELSNFRKLNTLTLSENQLIELPIEIGQLTTLKNLSLIDNKLACLPDEFKNLTNLKRLYLDHIKLLPRNFTHLPEISIYYALKSSSSDIIETTKKRKLN